MDIKHVLDHIVYFEHTGRHGEELPAGAPVPVWDDPYSADDDQMVAMLEALRDLEAPGETVELRMQRHGDSQQATLIHVTREREGRYAITVTPLAVFSRRAEQSLQGAGFRRSVGSQGDTRWTLDEYPASLETLPSFLDNLAGEILRLDDDYSVEEVSEATSAAEEPSQSPPDRR